MISESILRSHRQIERLWASKYIFYKKNLRFGSIVLKMNADFIQGFKSLAFKLRLLVIITRVPERWKL